jgi:hypothetical protein
MNLRSNGPSDYRAVTVYPLQYGIPGCNPVPKANTTPLYQVGCRLYARLLLAKKKV